MRVVPVRSRGMVGGYIPRVIQARSSLDEAQHVISVAGTNDVQAVSVNVRLQRRIGRLVLQGESVGCSRLHTNERAGGECVARRGGVAVLVVPIAAGARVAKLESGCVTGPDELARVAAALGTNRGGEEEGGEGELHSVLRCRLLPIEMIAIAHVAVGAFRGNTKKDGTDVQS